MSYQVLARKWRPKIFSELVGQQHVVRALSHALDSGRIHHAFLFTGTRGVGKTTIARIFAKSLNCETGITSTPCGICSACMDISAGRFFDLLEIDAASNTGVDDVRVLIENAQYAPARGRMKVYLIDEVHMLSKNAFNALLKTLEEPPEHVKFLLATTDPQKLPVTVLSRCLQFNLRRLSIAEIQAQINKILEAEEIPYDEESTRELARSGNGSLRDALSLLDQAIAFGGGKLMATEVRAMLGTLDRSGVMGLLDAIVANDGQLLAERIQATADFQPDFGNVLAALAEILHSIQVAQLMPEAKFEDAWPVTGFATRLAPETVQLFYQLLIAGQRDLHLAPSARIGFEMCLLRLLAFQPQPPGGERHVIPASKVDEEVFANRNLASNAGVKAPVAPVASQNRTRLDNAAAVTTAKKTNLALASDAEIRPHLPLDPEIWALFSENGNLRGPTREFAANLSFIEDSGAGSVRFGIAASLKHLQNDMNTRGLRDALSKYLGREVTINVEPAADEAIDSLAVRLARQRSAEQTEAEATISADPFIQRVIAEMGARILPNSINPTE